MPPYIVQEFGTSVTVDVVRVKVTPAKLNVNPVLVACRAVKNVFVLKMTIREFNKRGYQQNSHPLRVKDGKCSTVACETKIAPKAVKLTYLISREKQDVGARTGTKLN